MLMYSFDLNYFFLFEFFPPTASLPASMDPDGLKMLQSVVGDRGKLIFAMLCGSYSYNMNTPSSDKVWTFVRWTWTFYL